MTETRCPAGHLSSQTDYCDVCGARMSGPPAVLEATPEVPSGEEPGTPAAGEFPCPRCGAPNTAADRFCEGCGLNFESPSALQLAPPSGWEATVVADRGYYERADSGDIEFPASCPERRIALRGDQVSIGRRSASRAISPDIDLFGPPQDIGVSHEHALLTLGAEGTWALLDRGSTNGTFVNEDESPIPVDRPVTLRDGDRIHLGAWTTITLSRIGTPAPEAR